MKKITVYILLLLLLSSICSCLDDKNNYDYTPIKELKGTIIAPVRVSFFCVP